MHAAIYSNAYAHDPSRDSKAPKRPDNNECGLSCIEPVQILANRLHNLYNTSTDTKLVLTRQVHHQPPPTQLSSVEHGRIIVLVSICFIIIYLCHFKETSLRR